MEINKLGDGSRIRVFVADSSRIHTQLLCDALKHDSEFDVLQCGTNSTGLIAEVVASEVHVLLISAYLDEQPMRGLHILRELRSVYPRIRAAVLMDSYKSEIVLEAFRAGARGIFSRQNSIELLAKCVRSLYEGQIWANGREMSLAVEALSNEHAIRPTNSSALNLLTKREIGIVECVAEGLTNREIADRLKLSQHTVKNYLFRVFDKLGVSSRVELLFMTLGQHSSVPDLAELLVGKDHTDGVSFALCKKAAEQDVPAAQLALAQMYWARREEPINLIHSYMWYLIAADQLSRARIKAGKSITPEQRIEAEKRAAAWLSKSRGIASASVSESQRTRSAGLLA